MLSQGSFVVLCNKIIYTLTEAGLTALQTEIPICVGVPYINVILVSRAMKSSLKRTVIDVHFAKSVTIYWSVQVAM